MYDLIIIGAGPAGLTAALYAGRFRLKVLVLEKMSPGGQILLSPNIENYPGFPGGIPTFDLIEKFTQQAKEVGVNIENKEVTALEAQGPAYKIDTPDASYQAKTIIISTGARPKSLGLPGEERLIGKGVSYCGTCDGPLFKNKDVVVVGGGDRAVEDAIFLSTYAKSVNLIHRRAQFRASKILVEKAQSTLKINFILDSTVEEILGENKVKAVKVKNLKTGANTEIPCEGVFVFVGTEPNTLFLKNFLELDVKGFIITDQEMQTSKQGVFACGDCCKKTLYQVVNACGEGAVAADSARKYLANL